MHEELPDRILRASRTCTERLYRRPYRQLVSPQLNQTELQSHGPGIVGIDISQCLKQLTDRQPQRTPEQGDLAALQRLLSGLMRVRAVTYAPMSRPEGYASFPDMLEQYLRPAVHTGKSLGLTFLGALLDLPRATELGIVEAWSRAGFYLFLDQLSAAYPEPTPDRFHKILVNARLLAYSLSTLEQAATLDELATLKKGLAALAAGAVPIAYTPPTKTLHVGNWYP